LSWYEWGLYLLRLQNDQDKERFKWEEDWERTRIMWATMINLNSSKKVLPQDLIKLPRDKDNKNEVTPEKVKDLEQFAKKRFGSTIKRNVK